MFLWFRGCTEKIMKIKSLFPPQNNNSKYFPTCIATSIYDTFQSGHLLLKQTKITQILNFACFRANHSNIVGSLKVEKKTYIYLTLILLLKWGHLKVWLTTSGSRPEKFVHTKLSTVSRSCVLLLKIHHLLQHYCSSR